MQEVSSAPFAHERPPIAHFDRTADFLRASAILMDMIANYGEQLEATIFCPSNSCPNAKLFRKHRRTLKSIDAFRVLAVIWKESEFVTEAALVNAGLVRDYQERQLTAYSLAQDFSEAPQQVARLNSRIRTIGIAAAAYQLVDRNGVPLVDGDGVNGNKVILRGTRRLHKFMSEFNAKNIEVMALLAHLFAVGPNALRGTDSLFGRHA